MVSDRPRNAFERARNATLAFGQSWWEQVTEAARKMSPGATISNPEKFWIGADSVGFGQQLLERRTITLPKEGRRKARSWTITRTVPVRFSMLPPDVLEEIARGFLQAAEAEWRAAQFAVMMEMVPSLDGEEDLDIARMCLGEDATEAELAAYAASLVPDALRQGGVAAERFFDESVSIASIDEDAEGGPALMPAPPPPPGSHPIDVGEWDFYSPEEVDRYSGPESDPAYAMRVVRLCEAMRADPDRATHIAMILGAVTREWELWRENEEFLKAGRAHFAEQSRLARSKREKPWMAKARADFAEGAIGPNVATYARKLHQQRELNPPGVETIKNFISRLRRAERAADAS